MTLLMRARCTFVSLLLVAACSGDGGTTGSLGSANAREVISREVVRELPRLYRALDLVLDVVRIQEASRSNPVPDPEGLGFRVRPSGAVEVSYAPPGAQQALSMVIVFSDQFGPIDPAFTTPSSLWEVFVLANQRVDLRQIDAEWSIESVGTGGIVGSGALQDTEPLLAGLQLLRCRIVSESTNTELSLRGVACAARDRVGAELLGRFVSPAARLFDGAPDSLECRLTLCGACGGHCGPSAAEDEAQFALFESIFFQIDRATGAVIRVGG